MTDDSIQHKHRPKVSPEPEDRFGALFRLSTQAIGYATPDGLLVDVNDSYVRLTGYSRKELAGKKNQDLTPARYHRMEAEAIKRIVRNREVVEYEKEYIRRDGSLVPVSVTAFIVNGKEDGSASLALIVKDITEQKRAEESALQLSSIVDCSDDAIVSATLDGIVTGWNRAAERIFGYSDIETVGHRVYFLFQEQGAADVRRALERIARGDNVSGFEIEGATKDRKRVDAFLSIFAARDDTTKPIGVFMILRDLGERKAMQEQLRMAQKMEAVGRLSRGIAHDFNNLLTAIIGYSQLVLSGLKRDDPVRKEIEEIDKAGKRAAELTRQLLVFSRKQVLRPALLDLNAVVSNWASVLRRMIGEDIRLVTAFEPSLGFVKADPGEIDQVLMNVIVNARDAMPEGGDLKVETANVRLDETAARGLGVQPGDYVMLSVSDTGVGLDAEIRSRVFEPFSGNASEGSGRGLGLSTVKSIVKQYGGCVRVDSRTGQGTMFVVYLPKVAEEAGGDAHPDQLDLLPRGAECVLLVEDEALVRELAARILRQQGYTVLEARTGEEALSAARAHIGQEIHLLVTDMVMPQMSGRLLADLIKSERPGIKVLFSSGYLDKAIVQPAGAAAGPHFLQKPFTPGLLARKVREVLDGNG